MYQLSDVKIGLRFNCCWCCLKIVKTKFSIKTCASCITAFVDIKSALNISMNLVKTYFFTKGAHICQPSESRTLRLTKFHLHHRIRRKSTGRIFCTDVEQLWKNSIVLRTKKCVASQIQDVHEVFNADTHMSIRAFLSGV